MKGDSKFSTGWKAAIIAALVLNLLATGAARRQREADEKRIEKRIDAIEKSIEKIETYLYEQVAPAIQNR